MEERIIELETKVAFQDETIELLNQTVIQQQQAIDQLQLELKEIKSMLEARRDTEVVTRTEEPLPPHY
ncbi:MAG: SlyX family protein [Gammaproteobacteria bacterium]|nr:SlyX family protein [Gammaproteobacteria bacterium]